MNRGLIGARRQRVPANGHAAMSFCLIQGSRGYRDVRGPPSPFFLEWARSYPRSVAVRNKLDCLLSHETRIKMCATERYRTRGEAALGETYCLGEFRLSVLSACRRSARGMDTYDGCVTGAGSNGTE